MASSSKTVAAGMGALALYGGASFVSAPVSSQRLRASATASTASTSRVEAEDQSKKASQRYKKIYILYIYIM